MRLSMAIILGVVLCSGCARSSSSKSSPVASLTGYRIALQEAPTFFEHYQSPLTYTLLFNPGQDRVREVRILPCDCPGKSEPMVMTGFDFGKEYTIPVRVPVRAHASRFFGQITVQVVLDRLPPAADPRHPELDGEMGAHAAPQPTPFTSSTAAALLAQGQHDGGEDLREHTFDVRARFADGIDLHENVITVENGVAVFTATWDGALYRVHTPPEIPCDIQHLGGKKWRITLTPLQKFLERPGRTLQTHYLVLEKTDLTTRRIALHIANHH